MTKTSKSHPPKLPLIENCTPPTWVVSIHPSEIESPTPAQSSPMDECWTVPVIRTAPALGVSVGNGWPVPAAGYAIHASGGDPYVAPPPDDVKDAPRIVAEVGRAAAQVAPPSGGAPASHVRGPSSRSELAGTDAESGAPLELSAAEPPPSLLVPASLVVPVELAASGVMAVPEDEEQPRFTSVPANAREGKMSPAMQR